MKIIVLALVLLVPAIAGAQTCIQADLNHPLQATLTWIDNSTNETGFVLERKLNAGAYVALTPIAPNTTQVIDATVVRSTVVNTYTYRLKAVLVSATGTLSSTYTTEQCIAFDALPLNPPTAPSGFTVSQNSASPTNSLSLTWDDVATEASFEVVGRKAVGNRTFVKLATLPADITNYDWTGLQAHTSYCGRVRAVNAKGASAYSPIACNTTSR